MTKTGKRIDDLHSILHYLDQVISSYVSSDKKCKIVPEVVLSNHSLLINIGEGKVIERHLPLMTENKRKELTDNFKLAIELYEKLFPLTYVEGKQDETEEQFNDPIPF